MYVINLDTKFKPFTNDREIPVEVFSFYGGESHIKLSPTLADGADIFITHRLTSPKSIMELVLAADAARRQYPNSKVYAFIPYLPYARQDRVMVDGEPFSLGVIANIINSCNFNEVHILDAHSDVAPALINNFRPIHPMYVWQTATDIQKRFEDFRVIAPDGGALKKVYKHCKFAFYEGAVYDASKLRDVSTGKIIRTVVNAPKEDIEGKTVWIMDDVISKGGTFAALATELKAMGAANVVLSVSHYEGVADIEAMKAAGLDHIYTTNSMIDIESDFITQFHI